MNQAALQLFIQLIQQMALVVVEMENNFDSSATAWEALANAGESYPLVLFDDWVGQQYLTDRNAWLERFDL